MRAANLRTLVHVVLVMTIACSPIWAQRQGASVDRIHQKSVLIALSEVPVRDRPPANAAVYAKGAQTGILRPDDVITVSKEQIVPTLLGDQKWVSFTRSDKAPSTGWILVGTTGKMSTVFAEGH